MKVALRAATNCPILPLLITCRQVYEDYAATHLEMPHFQVSYFVLLTAALETTARRERERERLARIRGLTETYVPAFHRKWNSEAHVRIRSE